MGNSQQQSENDVIEINMNEFNPPINHLTPLLKSHEWTENADDNSIIHDKSISPCKCDWRLHMPHVKNMHKSSCSTCKREFCSDCQMRMCYNCGRNICPAHATITNSRSPFTNTFCNMCLNKAHNPNTDNQIGQQTTFKLSYYLTDKECWAQKKQMAGITALLDALLSAGNNHNNNAMILIKKVIEKCPSLHRPVFNHYDGSSCCYRGYRTLNIFQYLIYKKYGDLSIILPLLRQLKVRGAKNERKTIKSAFKTILSFACHTGHGLSNNVNHELLALQWIKVCNVMYDNCSNGQNLLLKEAMDCQYDIHHDESRSAIKVTPLKYIEQSDKIYAKLYHGRASYKPQQIIDYIKSMISEQVNEEQKDERKDNINDNDQIYRPWHTSDNDNDAEMIDQLQSNILMLCKDENNFLIKVPKLFDFQLKSALPYAQCALAQDPILPKLRFKLCPKKYVKIFYAFSAL